MKTYLEESLLRAGLSLCEYGERVTLYGFCAARVEGHKGLVDYAEDRVVVKLRGKKLVVTGKCLRVREVTPDELFLSGRICGVVTEG